MKKIIFIILMSAILLFASCDNDVSQNTASEESIKSVNVLFNANGGAILLEGSVFYLAPYEEGISVGTRGEGIGFMVGSGLSCSEVKLSVEGDTVTVDEEGSIEAEAFTVDTETYYVFTYGEKVYLLPSSVSYLDDYEATTLSLDWEDVSSEQLYVNSSKCIADSVYYAEDTDTPYYKVVGGIEQPN